jgi:enamine deaminase RidA (YjgF/YER057c/UK114 family)
MSMKFIRKPEGLGEPLGRYSHVAVAAPGGEIVVVAGQVGMDSDGVVAGGGVGAQTKKAFENLGTALAAAGAGFGDVLKTTTFLVGPELLPEFMAARGEAFAEIFPTGVYPPNTLLMVSRLVEPELLVEVEALAVTYNE